MNPLTLVITLALLGEVIIEILKPLLRPVMAWGAATIDADVDAGWLYLSTLLGVFLALLYQADLLLVVGLPPLTGPAVYFGPVATGLIIGRGANFVHDVYSRLSGEPAKRPITS